MASVQPFDQYLRNSYSFPTCASKENCSYFSFNPVGLQISSSTSPLSYDITFPTPPRRIGLLTTGLKDNPPHGRKNLALPAPTSDDATRAPKELLLLNPFLWYPSFWCCARYVIIEDKDCCFKREWTVRIASGKQSRNSSLGTLLLT